MLARPDRGKGRRLNNAGELPPGRGGRITGKSPAGAGLLVLGGPKRRLSGGSPYFGMSAPTTESHCLAITSLEAFCCSTVGKTALA